MQSKSKRWGLAVAVVAVAIGGIVLIKQQGYAGESRVTTPRVFDLSSAPPPSSNRTMDDAENPSSLSFERPAISGTIDLSQGAVVGGGEQRVNAQVLLRADEVRREGLRRPVALSIVLDRSGSMTGEKLSEARRALFELVEAMQDTDWISIVVYSDSSQLLQPMVPLATVRRGLTSRILSIQAGGGTNIPPALRVGVRTLNHAPEGLVRRVILLSDGRDHSGMSLSDIEEDVRRSANRGVVFSSLGVGVDYSEAFMTSVADAGRGSYAFLREGSEIGPFLQRELDHSTMTVVEDLRLDLNLPTGWRLLRAYGAEADGQSGSLTLPIGSLASGEVRRVVLELGVRSDVEGGLRPLSAALSYREGLGRRERREALGQLALRVVEDEQEAWATRDEAVHADTVSAAIDSQQASSIEAWRAGNRAQAVAQTRDNIRRVEQLQALSPSEQRVQQLADLRRDLDNFQSNDVASARGRAEGLHSNQARRSRLRGW